MINIRFYQDEEGYLKADTAPQYLLLSQYFESEIQGIAAECQDLLATIQEIESGDRTQIEGVGNSLGLKITAEKVTIWSEFTEAKSVLELPLADFKKVVEECFSFLRFI